MTRLGMTLIGTMLLAAGGPGTAQPAPGSATATPHVPGRHNPMFAGMSDAGRGAMLAAMRGVDMRAGKVEVAAARDRMLAVLDAEQLDPAALRRAMDDERAAVALQQAQQAKRQVAMLTGFGQLSLADRRAFVADARAIRDRVESRVAAQQQGQIRAAAGVNQAGNPAGR